MWQYRGTHFGNVAIEGDTFRKCGNTGGHISEMWQYRGTQLGNVAIEGTHFGNVALQGDAYRKYRK